MVMLLLTMMISNVQVRPVFCLCSIRWKYAAFQEGWMEIELWVNNRTVGICRWKKLWMWYVKGWHLCKHWTIYSIKKNLWIRNTRILRLHKDAHWNAYHEAPQEDQEAVYGDTERDISGGAGVLWCSKYQLCTGHKALLTTSATLFPALCQDISSFHDERVRSSNTSHIPYSRNKCGQCQREAGESYQTWALCSALGFILGSPLAISGWWVDAEKLRNIKVPEL